MQIKIWIKRDTKKSMIKASVMDFISINYYRGQRRKLSETGSIKCFLKDVMVERNL